MKRKNYIGYIICALLVVCVFCLRNYLVSRQTAKEIYTSVKTVVSDSTRHYRDLYNREHATRMQAEGSLETMQLVYGRLLDSVSLALHTSQKNIEQVTALSMETRAAIRPRVDTVYTTGQAPHLRLQYADKWLNISGTIGDTPTLFYQSYDSLIIATYRKRKGLFRRVDMLDAYSINPHSRIDGITGIEIKKRAARLSIGPCIGFGYNGLQWSPFLGASLQYSLIKF